MSTQLIHGETTTCSCCGSDTSRFELYLDNGFGFSLSEKEGHEVTLVPVHTEPAEDFNAFYREQVAFLNELGQEVTAEEWTRWNFAIRAAFAHGIEHAARSVGADLNATEVTKQMVEADILCRLVADRLGPSAPIEEWIAELKHMVEQGMTPEETALVNGIIEKLARSLESSQHYFSREVAHRLRGSELTRWHTLARNVAVQPRRAPGSRTPRSRRRVHRARARSPGREPPPEPDPARIACSGGFVALLGDRA